MNAVDLRTLLEQDLTWRQDELRTLGNSLRSGGLDLARIEYKRPMVVMTYAHLEGFVKYALGTYADHINKTGLTCSKMVEPLAASNLTNDFRAVRQSITTSSSTIAAFEGKRLAQAKRETDFIRGVRALETAAVDLPIDEVVSLDWNLNMDVFERVMFRLGLSFDDIQNLSPSVDFSSAVSFLVRVRNDVAHGSRNVNIPDGQFKAAVSKASEVCSNLIRVLYEAARSQAYCVAV